MELLLKLGTLSLPARMTTAEPIPGGYLLTGAELRFLHPFGATRFYRQGWHSWSPTTWVELATPPTLPQPSTRWPQIDDPVAFTQSIHSGSGVGALEAPDGNILLLGALAPGARVEADADLLRGSYSGTAGPWFLGYGAEADLFTHYAALLGDYLGRRGQAPAPRVWCSWYSFYNHIGEEPLLATLHSLQGLPFDVFQVDDGWQLDMGDWEANPKFPAGMAELANRIREAGLTPGLWLAPFIARPTSALYREHPDWILRDENNHPVPAGDNWGGFYALDTTHPRVKIWLEETIRRVLDWGYTYLKLDFLYAGALPGVRYHDLPREEAYRQALTLIREEMGPETYLLACGAPVLPSLGLVDGLRIGPDVAPYWDNEDRSCLLHDTSAPGALNAIRTSLHRLWLRPLCHTDPDVVFFRTRYNLLNPYQQTLLRDLALIAGFKATSDLPTWLDREEQTALENFLQAQPTVVRQTRYQFTLDERVVDFSLAL